MTEWVDIGYDIAATYAYVAAILFVLHILNALYPGGFTFTPGNLFAALEGKTNDFFFVKWIKHSVAFLLKPVSFMNIEPV